MHWPELCIAGSQDGTKLMLSIFFFIEKTRKDAEALPLCLKPSLSSPRLILFLLCRPAVSTRTANDRSAGPANRCIALIEQNQQEARQILIDNPLLTRALFQNLLLKLCFVSAQIMLGMVQSPKVMSNTQQACRQPQPAQVGQPQIVHSLQTVPAKVGEQSKPGSSQSLLSPRQQHPTQPSISLPLASGSSQSLLSARQQHPTQPSISVPPASVPPLTFQWKAMPLPLSEPQTKGFLNLQVPSVTPIQSSQIQNISQPNPAAPHYSNLPSHMPMISVHPQQTLQNPGLFNQLLQPPLQLQPRQVAMQPFALQFHPQMPHSLGLQPSSAPQQLLSQPLFHSGITPPSSFPQGQAPLPSLPPQHLYQMHIFSCFLNKMPGNFEMDAPAVSCKSMAVGDSVSEDMAWSLVWGVGGLLLLVWALRTLNWAWWTPRRLERALRAQGLNGTPYRFPNGDLKENVRLAKEALSTPMPLTHNIVPRVLPFLRRAIDEYGKICFTWFGPVPRVTIMDPELVREVLSNKFGHFGKPKGNPLGRFLFRGLVSYEGEKWVKHRRIMNPAFHVEKLKRMLPAFCACCSDLMSRWENLVGSEACYEMDVWPEFQSFTGDVISRTAFGSSYEEGRRIFQLQAEQAELLIQSIQNLYIPGYMFLPTPKNKRIKAVNREVRVLLRGIIKKREQAIKLGKASNDDLLGLLMESNLEHYQEHGNKNAGMTTEDVIEECKLFYFAGQETTAVLLTWTMIVLSMHPGWQIRARQEVLQVFGERKPDFDGLSHLKNVTMILYEVLRLYPPGVFLQRQTHKTMKLGDVIYPPGVTLLLPVIFIHHDPNYWGKDANEFNPERFAEGVSKASKDQVAFFPFEVFGRSIELKLEERRRMTAQQPQQQQQVANSFTSQFAVMSKAQLYDILCQMKALIEQNQQEARQILIDNPLLTRALFQAQIMLGMVQSPNVMSNTQQSWQQPQPSQVGQPQIVHSLQTVPAKVGEQSEPGSSQSLLSARQQHPIQPSISLPLASGSSQSLLSARQQHPTQPSISVPPASVPPLTFQSKAMPLPLSEPQTKGFLNLQVPSVTPIQSSQIQNISQPNPAAPHYSNLPSHMPMISVHPQQTLQNPGLFNQLLQPPLPLQPRQVAMQPFALQFHPQMPHSLGLQPSSLPQQLLSQPLFHSGITPPSSFPQGQAPLPSQPPQHLYQVGSSHVGTDYGTQVSTSMQKDRGAPWVLGSQLPGLPPMISGQMVTGTSGQPPRAPPLTPEMEKALLQQVMGLTPEQINLLPPEQRNQVLQLREMLK
ncbi:unnamed protein product [Musa acuminata var. zebrina]